MRLLIRGLLLSMAPVLLQAQSGQIIRINHQPFAAHENSKRCSKELDMIRQQTVMGYAPALLRFHELPSGDQRLLLNAQTGIRLTRYAGHHTYYALIPEGIRENDLNGWNFFGIYPIPPEIRLAPALQNQAFPDYALQSDGSLRIIVVGFEHIPPAFMMQELMSLGYSPQRFSEHVSIFSLTVPPQELPALTSLPFVAYVEPAYPPALPDNREEVTGNRANLLQNGLLFPYDGSGVWIGLNDDGAVSAHIDLQGRIDNTAVGQADEGNHGNHVAGTLLGAGNLNPITRGHAPGAQLKTYFAYQSYQPQYGAWFDIPNTYVEPGITITNTAVSDLVCNGGYNSLSQLLDQQTLDYPLLNHVLSAGNAGQENCGPIAGFYTITGGHKTAKNCITVGSVDDYDKIDEISSRGPAKDGRLKPEIMAAGVDVYSTYANNEYKSLSGTSMACAGISGILALLTQSFKEHNGEKMPPSALLKAALLNTADDMGWAGPDWKHGYGRVNARRAERLLTENRYVTGLVDHGQTVTFPLNVPAGVRQLRVMLYWHDAPAALGAAKDLVNDLQFQLQLPNGNMLDPWILDPTPVKDSLNKAAWRGVDTLNNHEQITLNNPMASGSYTLIVHGATVPLGPQEFYIVYDFCYDELTLTYPVGGESWTPNEKQIIRWDSYGLLKPLTLEISYDDGLTWNLIAAGLDSFLRCYEFTVPQQSSGRCRVRISRSDTSSVSQWFSIFPTPAGLKWQQICPLTARLSWNAVPGATHYETFLLGPYEMQPVGTTTKNFFDFSGLNTNNTDWVAVRAYGNDSIVSRRSLALLKPAGLLNCTLSANLSLTAISPKPYPYSACMDLKQSLISVTITNTAQNDMSGFYISYQADNSLPVTEWYSGVVSTGEQATYTFATPADLSAEGPHEIRCWISAASDQNPWDDTLKQQIMIAPGQLVFLPVVETFDAISKCETTNSCSDGICPLNLPWINLTNLMYDSIDWRVHAGNTPGDQTGPSGDFNTSDGKGHYIYLEAGNCKNKSAHLLLPCVDLTTAKQPRLVFARHQYGQGMGSLSIDLFVQGAWLTDWFYSSGNQGNFWIADTLDLSAFCGHVITLRFRGTTGNTSTSDLALDALAVYDAAAVYPSITVNGAACADSALQVINTSTGEITYTSWSFGPDAFPAYAEQTDTVTVVFSSAGSKTVSLTVGNAYDTLTLVQDVMIRKPPVAQFTSMQNSSGSFVFSSTSPDADHCLWLFGDGTQTTGCEVMHDFTVSGIFTVTLVSSNECGSDTAVATIVVSHNPSEVAYVPIAFAPNPFDHQLTIRTVHDVHSDAWLRFYLASGQLLHEFPVASGSTVTVGTASWPAGVYLATYEDARHIYRFRLIKR